VIHITEVAADKAALQIADVMDDKGGQWLVNSVDDEGYIMARVGSPFANRLQRSGATLAGPFNARWKIVFIAADLQEAKCVGNIKIARKAETAARRMYRGKTIRRSRNTVMMHVALALSASPLTSDAIAERIGVDEQAVRNALRRLMHVGTVRRGRKVPDGGVGGVRSLYEAVA
jgi:hypothetical protein